MRNNDIIIHSILTCIHIHTYTPTHIYWALSIRGACSLAVLSDRWLVTELNGRIFYCRLKEEENERWGIERKKKGEKLLHYTREVNHSMCRRSQSGIYIYTHCHMGTCMNTIRPVLALLHLFSLFPTYDTHIHINANTHVEIIRIQAWEKLWGWINVRLRWLALIEEKELWEQRNIMTFSLSAHTAR